MKANKHPAGRVAGKIPHFIADETSKYRATRALTEAQIIKAAKSLAVNPLSAWNATDKPGFNA